MRFALSQSLPCTAAALSAVVRQPGLLNYVAAPLITFQPAPGTVVGPAWEERTYWFKMRLFGVLPIGRQAVCVSMEQTDNNFHLHDAGYSPLISKWDHHITVESRHADTARYEDSVEIEAGLLTPLVWLFARLFFAHRQRRLRKLVSNDFAGLATTEPETSG